MIYTVLWVAFAMQLAIAAVVGADHLRRRIARWADGRRRVRAGNRIRLERALLALATVAPPAVDDRPGTDQAAYDACMAILATTDHRTEDTP